MKLQCFHNTVDTTIVAVQLVLLLSNLQKQNLPNTKDFEKRPDNNLVLL